MRKKTMYEITYLDKESARRKRHLNTAFSTMEQAEYEMKLISNAKRHDKKEIRMAWASKIDFKIKPLTLFVF